jgi:N-acetylneuraminic acid mutarotase
LPEARCAYGLAAFQDKLYLFGGRDGDAFKDTIFIFSPVENKWATSKARLPQPLGYLGAAVLEGHIYVVGGYDGREEFATTYAFDPARGTWQQKASLNEKRGGLGLISSSKNLFAIGGGWDQVIAGSEKYDPQTNTWTTFETPFNSQWRNLGITVIDTTLYVAGGWNGDDKEFMNTLSSYQFLYQLFLPVSISE